MARKRCSDAVFEIERDDAAAGAVLVHDQIEREILDEELRRLAQRLTVERVQHGVAGAVGGGARALRRRAFAVIRRHAAERPLIDLAVLGAREGHAVVLELVDGVGRVAAQIFDGVLIAEPVGALDGVVHVPAPIVRPHVAERRGDAALRGNRMRARRKHLRDARRLEPGFGAAERRPQACATGADDDDVIRMIDDRVSLAAHSWCSIPAFGLAILCRHQAQAPKLSFKMEKMLASAMNAAKKVFSISAAIFNPSLCT